jgi:two-component system sensor kinase FixL
MTKRGRRASIMALGMESMVNENRHHAANARAAISLTTELRQPLTAASNYIGTAQLLLRAPDGRQSREAVNCLERAGEQILRAGDILRHLSDLFAGDAVGNSAET